MIPSRSIGILDGGVWLSTHGVGSSSRTGTGPRQLTRSIAPPAAPSFWPCRRTQGQRHQQLAPVCSLTTAYQQLFRIADSRKSERPSAISDLPANRPIPPFTTKSAKAGVSVVCRRISQNRAFLSFTTASARTVVSPLIAARAFSSAAWPGACFVGFAPGHRWLAGVAWRDRRCGQVSA
jgi:hypothetical protein